VKRVFCTWGEHGAGTVEIHTGTLCITEPHLPKDHHVVDTVGAGDVFIAMALQPLRSIISDWVKDPDRHLKMGVELCGRKICQEGFSNLLL